MGYPLKPGLKIGLLGGSFNPAHGGHLEITQRARSALGLDQCWWLVTPQNPLKSAGDYAPLHKRLRQAQNVAQGHAWLRVTDIETKLGTRYTIDSLTKIITRHPSQRFVWIMGADSLAQFHRWKDWQRIGRLIPICVMSRPGDERDALSSVAARRWARHRLPRRQAKKLISTRPPAWVYLPIVHNPESATRLRQLK